MKYNNKSMRLKCFYTKSIPVTMPAYREMKAASGNDISKCKSSVVILLLIFLALLLLVYKFTSPPGIMYGFIHPFGTWGGLFIVGFLVLCLTV